ncbi:GntR family transcriptional regulator [Parapusillimonas sp. SGNA-6]|nr:GntR family transcriptional regulator [Parapusillimonas sp. SGNA-6]
MKNSDLIRHSIEASIRTGKLAPGTLIDEQELAREFNVSRTPVREALLHLQAQGIVESMSRNGMSVTRLTIQELLAIWELMAEMEAAAARLACDRMTDEELARLDKLHRESADIVAGNDAAAWSEVNYAFHMALYDGCRNPFLKEELIKLRLRTAGYLKQAYRSIGRAQASYEQHGELLQALLARDAEQASKMMSRHISLAQGAKGLTELLITMPDSFLEKTS